MSGYAPIFRRDVRDLLSTYRPDTAHAAVVVLAYLTVEAEWETGIVSLTDGQVAEAVGMTEKKAGRVRRILVKIGAVEVVRTGRGGWRGKQAQAQVLRVTSFDRRDVDAKTDAKMDAKADAKNDDESQAGGGSADVTEDERGRQGGHQGGCQGGSTLKKGRREEGKEDSAPQATLFPEAPRPTCSAQGCPEPATVEGKCLFCGCVWEPWERAREKRGCNNSGKKEARKAWNAAVRRKGSPPAVEIAAALMDYADVHEHHLDSDGFMPFMPYITKWLSNDKWNDPPPVATRRSGDSRGGITEQRRRELMLGAQPALSAEQRAEQIRQAQDRLRRDLETIRDHLAQLPDGHPELYPVRALIDSGTIDFDAADALLHRLGAAEHLVNAPDLNPILRYYSPLDIDF